MFSFQNTCKCAGNANCDVLRTMSTSGGPDGILQMTNVLFLRTVLKDLHISKCYLLSNELLSRSALSIIPGYKVYPCTRAGAIVIFTIDLWPRSPPPPPPVYILLILHGRASSCWWFSHGMAYITFELFYFDCALFISHFVTSLKY